ncbi:MAG: DUF87 domain-containing protein [Thermoproteota archaeon]
MKFKFSEDFEIDTEEEPWRSEGIRIALYSAPGTGKSYTVAACIVEPFLEQGGTVIIFEPRSEWHTLKEAFSPIMVIGGPFQDAPLAPNSARIYAEAIVKHGVSMIFDFSETEDKDLVRFSAELLARLYTLQNVYRRPLLLFFEEMAEYCPLRSTGRSVEPWIYDRMKSRVVKIATQGRPLGFNLVFTSQRPAQLDFTVRMMANLSLYGKFHPRDLTDLREVLRSYDAAVKAEDCVNMSRGCWIAIAAGEAKMISITAKRRTTHGADTPSLKSIAPLPEQARETIEQLAKVIVEALERERREETEVEKARARIRELESQLEEAKKEIERLKTALAVKETLKVEIKPVEVKIPENKFLTIAHQQPHYLPSTLESLDENAKQVWLLLKQKPGRYKVEIMAALGWGRKRLEKVLRVLQNRRLIKIQGKKIYALEPII